LFNLFQPDIPRLYLRVIPVFQAIISERTEVYPELLQEGSILVAVTDEEFPPFYQAWHSYRQLALASAHKPL
jgi:hypothetical protein